MKIFSKKFIVLLTLTSLLVSTSVPALAANISYNDYFENNQEILYGDYCDYTLNELKTMIPATMSSIDNINSEHNYRQKI